MIFFQNGKVRHVYSMNTSLESVPERIVELLKIGRDVEILHPADRHPWCNLPREGE